MNLFPTWPPFIAFLTMMGVMVAAAIVGHLYPMLVLLLLSLACLIRWACIESNYRLPYHLRKRRGLRWGWAMVVTIILAYGACIVQALYHLHRPH